MERITRTITTTEATVIFFDAIEMKTGETTYNVTGFGKTIEAVTKKLRKAFETDEFKIVVVKEMHETSRLYEMDIDTFIKNARVIEHR